MSFCLESNGKGENSYALTAGVFFNLMHPSFALSHSEQYTGLRNHPHTQVLIHRVGIDTKNACATFKEW